MAHFQPLCQVGWPVNKQGNMLKSSELCLRLHMLLLISNFPPHICLPLPSPFSTISIETFYTGGIPITKGSYNPFFFPLAFGPD